MKALFYQRIVAPIVQTVKHGGVVKIMHFSFHNYPLLYSKEKSNFLCPPEEQNNRIMTMSSHWLAIVSGYSRDSNVKKFKMQKTEKVKL